jgi:hypothetical protein
MVMSLLSLGPPPQACRSRPTCRLPVMDRDNAPAPAAGIRPPTARARGKSAVRRSCWPCRRKCRSCWRSSRRALCPEAILAVRLFHRPAELFRNPVADALDRLQFPGPGIDDGFNAAETLKQPARLCGTDSRETLKTPPENQAIARAVPLPGRGLRDRRCEPEMSCRAVVHRGVRRPYCPNAEVGGQVDRMRVPSDTSRQPVGLRRSTGC